MVVMVGATVAGVRSTLLRLSLLCLSIEDILLYGTESSLDFLDSGIETCVVGIPVSLFQLSYSCFDCGTFV